jgi:hypothetical protein
MNHCEDLVGMCVNKDSGKRRYRDIIYGNTLGEAMQSDYLATCTIQSGVGTSNKHVGMSVQLTLTRFWRLHCSKYCTIYRVQEST